MRHGRILGALVTATAAAAATASILVGGGAALAAGGGGPTPPWYPISPAPLGYLTFYNAQGQVVTGGSINSPGLAAYTVASTPPPGSGYTKATAYLFTPESGTNPLEWPNEEYSESIDNFPNSSAPAPIAATSNPVSTNTGDDLTIASIIANIPNTQTASGYVGLYDVRMFVGGPGISQSSDFWDTVISVNTTAGTWSVDYPDWTQNTTTAVTATASGSNVVLSAAVSPATAGTVSFWTGYGTSGAAQVGTTQTVTSSAGTASVTAPAPSSSTTFTAVFTPAIADTATISSFDVGSTGTATFPPAVSTTTMLTVSPPSPVKQGSPVTLTAAVAASDSSVPTGSVTFDQNGKSVGTEALSGGTATLVTSGLAPTGPSGEPLTAVYAPASGTSYGSSTSAAVSYEVDPVAVTPTLSGPGQVGQKETCTETASAGVSVSYAWSASGSSVGTGATLTVPAKAYAKSLSCTVTVSDGGGPASTATSASVKVKLGKALTATKKPTLSGPHKTGKTETVKPGTWSQKGVKFTYQWLLNGKVIKHATKSTFKPSSGDKNKKLSCRVTAHLTGYANGTKTTSSVKIT